MITLEPITPEVALIFKAVRLRALKDDPTAFSSTYAREVKISDEEWMNRSVRWSSDGAIGYIAFDANHACGLVACYAEEHDPSRAHIVSMWVDPAYRRTGVGKMLIDSLITWATKRGMHELKLMVTCVNDNAIHFYDRIGFRKSGVTGPYPNDPAIIEYEMLLPLLS